MFSDIDLAIVIRSSVGMLSAAIWLAFVAVNADGFFSTMSITASGSFENELSLLMSDLLMPVLQSRKLFIYERIKNVYRRMANVYYQM